MSSIHQSNIRAQPKDIASVKEIQEFEEFSTDTQRRKCTDILCIAIGVVFTLIVAIVSFAFYNHEHYIKANFPTDTDGKLCGIQYPGYPFVYFTSPTQPTNRLCVSKCPSASDKKLSCKPTTTHGCNYNTIPGYQVQKYQTQPFEDRNGHFCLPTDQTSRQTLIQKSKLNARNIFFNSADTYVTCSIVSAIVALVYLVVVQFFAKIVNRFVIYVGAAMLLVLVICIWTYPTEYVKSKIIIGLVLLAFLVVVAWTVWLYREAVLANGIFLQQATKFVRDLPWVLINIPLFLGILVLFEYIMILQLNSIWTHSDLDFNPQQSLYWQYKSQAGFLKFLWLIQAIWGLNFIKQSFNFIISSYATLWYNQYLNPDISFFQNLSLVFFPYRIYITKHFGSVIACSFMSAFFNIFDTIFDLARGNKVNRGNTVCDNLDCFFDLVRSEAMPYVAVTGNPYCNSARYCQYLCELSSVLDNSQSASRAYRIAAYSTLAGFSSILGLYIHFPISIFSIGVVFAINYFIVNFFVQAHADAADGILIIYLQNEQFSCRNLLSKPNKSRIDFGRDQIKMSSNKKTRQIVDQLENDELFSDQKHRKKLRQQS